MFSLAACAKEVKKDTPIASATAAPAVTTTAAPSGTTAGAHAPHLVLNDIRIPRKGSKVHVKWALPDGTAVNAEAPVKIRFRTSEGLAEVPPDQKTTGATVQDGFDVEIRPEPHATDAKLVGEVGLVICDAIDHSVCLPVHRTLELQFVIGADAAATQTLSLPLPHVKQR